MTKFALYVPLKAKPGKEKEVAEFLRSAVPLVNAEAGTRTWFAIQEGPSSFAIFDTFEDEAGRDAHLNGKVAAALMEKVKQVICLPRLRRFTNSTSSRTRFHDHRRCSSAVTQRRGNGIDRQLQALAHPRVRLAGAMAFQQLHL